MAYFIGHQQCAMDGSCKLAAVYNCRGCSTTFCCTHVIDHRGKLGEELNVITSEHNQLKDIFTQHTSDPNLHSLVKTIDEWEKESIEKIQQKAKDLREQLLQPITM